MNAIGQPMSRVDGRRKVTGGARYTADISLPTCRPRRNRPQQDRQRTDGIDRYNGRRTGPPACSSCLPTTTRRA